MTEKNLDWQYPFKVNFFKLRKKFNVEKHMINGVAVSITPLFLLIMLKAVLFFSRFNNRILHDLYHLPDLFLCTC